MFDTIFAIIRRVVKGKSLKAVFQADKGHLHHKLIEKGLDYKLLLPISKDKVDNEILESMIENSIFLRI